MMIKYIKIAFLLGKLVFCARKNTEWKTPDNNTTQTQCAKNFYLKLESIKLNNARNYNFSESSEEIEKTQKKVDYKKKNHISETNVRKDSLMLSSENTNVIQEPQEKKQKYDQIKDQNLSSVIFTSSSENKYVPQECTSIKIGKLMHNTVTKSYRKKRQINEIIHVEKTKISNSGYQSDKNLERESTSDLVGVRTKTQESLEKNLKYDEMRNQNLSSAIFSSSSENTYVPQESKDIKIGELIDKIIEKRYTDDTKETNGKMTIITENNKPKTINETRIKIKSNNFLNNCEIYQFNEYDYEKHLQLLSHSNLMKYNCNDFIELLQIILNIFYKNSDYTEEVSENLDQTEKEKYLREFFIILSKLEKSTIRDILTDLDCYDPINLFIKYFIEESIFCEMITIKNLSLKIWIQFFHVLSEVSNSENTFLIDINPNYYIEIKKKLCGLLKIGLNGLWDINFLHEHKNILMIANL